MATPMKPAARLEEHGGALRRSPAVRLHISIKDRQEVPQEVIKKVAQGHEVVEVDGFVFTRKRLDTMAVDSQGKNKKAKSEEAKPAECQQHAEQNLGQPGDCLLPPAGPADCQLDPGQHSGQPGDCLQLSPAARQLATGKLRADDQSGLVTVAGPPEQAGTTSNKNSRQGWLLRPMDGSSEDEAAAKQLLGAIPAVGSQQQRLLLLCNILSKEHVADVASGAPAEATELAARSNSLLERFQEGVCQALQNMTLICQDSQADPPGLSDRQASAIARSIAFQHQLEAYQQEEAEWISVQRDGSRLAEGLRAVDVHVASLLTIPPEASNLAANAQQNVGMALHNTQADVHRNLAFQVEGLCAMITSVEELVSRAEKQCSKMQAEYHKEKFRTFPHVDSPARLIHEIVKPRKSRMQSELQTHL